MINLSKSLKKLIAQAPELPGCYIYKDKDKNPLYVGKAKNLYNRVKSYFVKNADHTIKIQNMIKKIEDIEYVIANSDAEAFILETNLIRKYKPKYNTEKKDDKNYSWVFIDKKEDFPRIQILRKQPIQRDYVFGPYPAQVPIKRVLKDLRKIFPYRTCNRSIVEKDGKIISSNPKPCLYYHLGLCNAPCAGLENSSKYKKNLGQIRNYFNDKRQDVFDELKKRMTKLAFEKKYEEAAKIRDQITDLAFIVQSIDVNDQTDEFSFRKDKDTKNALALSDLISMIEDPRLKLHKDFKIEGYDISNIQGTNPTGSMVVFVAGMPDKSLYRHFKILVKNSPDDFAMHEEMQIRRWDRFLHSVKPGEEIVKEKITKSDSVVRAKPEKVKFDKSFSIKPDLVLIDGGQGQVQKALKVVLEKNIDVPVIGIAKREEILFIPKIDPDGSIKYMQRKLPNASQVKFLIQRIRDESHRFAINYHRKLRLKGQKLSSLREKTKITEELEMKLIRAFCDYDGIKRASKNDLAQIIKNGKTITKIMTFYKSN